MIESIATTVSLLSLVYGPLAFYMWRLSKRPCRLQREEDEYREWRERCERMWEKQRQRDLECIRQNNAYWDERMRELGKQVEEYEKVFGPV